MGSAVLSFALLSVPSSSLSNINGAAAFAVVAVAGTIVDAAVTDAAADPSGD